MRLLLLHIGMVGSKQREGNAGLGNKIYSINVFIPFLMK